MSYTTTSLTPSCWRQETFKTVALSILATTCLSLLSLVSFSQDGEGETPTCVQDVSFEVIDGEVVQGNEIEVAVTVTGYTNLGDNWFHGLIPTFGPGLTLVGENGAVCGDGAWEWFYDMPINDGTSAAGFFYETNPAIEDDLPNNNWGDSGALCEATWTFDFNLLIASDAQLEDIQIGINTTSDSESGNWAGNPECDEDPEFFFTPELIIEVEPELECPADLALDCAASISPEATGTATVLNFNPIVLPPAAAQGDQEFEDGSYEDLSYNDVVSVDGNVTTIVRTWTYIYHFGYYDFGDEFELQGQSQGGQEDLVLTCDQIITLTDDLAPVWDLGCQLEEIVTTANGGSCPADAVLSIALGDEFSVNDNWSIGSLFVLGVSGCVSDNCTTDSDLTIQVAGVATEGDACESTTTLTLVAIDQAGNVSEEFNCSYTFIDNAASVLTDFAAELNYTCLEDYTATVYTATDCGNDVDVTPFESNTGEMVEACQAITAVGLGDDWSLWLPGQDLLGSANFNFDANGGSFNQFADGSAHLSGTVVNDANPNEIYELDFWFQNRATWAEWSSAPLNRNYKDDAGQANGNHVDWSYYELVNNISTAVGAGDLAGSQLFFQHMPSDYYFGFQAGLGANNKNANYGMSGWFTYFGEIAGEAVEGNGDINVDMECETEENLDCIHNTEFTNLFFSIDACGNAAVVEQLVVINDNVAPTFTTFPEDMLVSCDELPIAIGQVVAEDNCTGDVTVSDVVEVITPGDCPNSFVIERGWLATDACGNTFSQVQTIVVEDNINPELIGLPEAEITEECDAVSDAAIVTATDNCSEGLVVAFEETIVNGDCAGQYTISRLWSVVDECGNAAEFAQTVNVIDTTAPVISGDIQIVLECDATDDNFVTAEDNCGTAELSYTQTLGSGGCLGAYVRVYTATDDCGNSSTFTQYITLTDTQAPIFEELEPLAFECDEVELMENGNYFGSEIEVADNCGHEITVSYEETIEEGACENSYTIVRTWTATDYCENESTYTQSVPVSDTTPPTFGEDFPQDQFVSCEDELPAVVLPSAFDNCDADVTVEATDMIEPGNCDGNYIVSRLYRAFDNCGNMAMQVQNIFVQDLEGPSFEELEPVTYECSDEVPVIEPIVSDNCSGVASLTFADGDNLEQECDFTYTFVRTWTATDNCGNVSVLDHVINIEDTTAPVIEGEFEITADCADALEDIYVTATDNCSDDVTITFQDEAVSGGFCAGRVIRTYTATDACGNSSTAEQIIGLIDEVAPEWISTPEELVIDCAQEVPAAEELEATDNCDAELEYTFNETTIDGSCPSNYTIVRTWTATDHCDNAIEHTQTITVQDITAPVITLENADDDNAVSDSYVRSCDSDEIDIQDFFSVEDDCSEFTVETTMSMEGDGCDKLEVYTIIATDACGNVSDATITFQLLDVTSPVFTVLPEDMTVECGDDEEASTIEAEDNCSDEVTITSEIYTGLAPWVLQTTGGNGTVETTDDANFTIVGSNFTDGEEVESPFDGMAVTANCTAAKPGTLTFDWTYETEDVDGPALDPAAIIINGQSFALSLPASGNDGDDNDGLGLILFQLGDEGNDNFQDGSFQIELEAGANISIQIDAGDDVLGGATLNVSNISFEAAELECPIVDCYIRQYIATDDCGNTATHSQFVVVEDTTGPVFDAYEAALEMPCDDVQPTELTAADACSSATVSSSDELVPGGCAGVIERTWTATDDCGNETIAVQTITLVDNVAPTASDYEAEVLLECGQAIPEFNVDFTDNCTEQLEIVEFSSISIDVCPQVIVRGYTATDPCGNTTTAEQTVTIQDTTAPVWSGEDTVLTLSCDEDSDLPFFTATDVCDQELLLEENTEVTPGDCAAESTTVYTYTATDACGNTATRTLTVIVEDNDAPTFVPAEYQNEFSCDEPLVVFVPETEDNCSLVTLTNVEETTPGQCPNEYTLTVTYTATDACGNAASQSFAFYVYDNTNPTFDFEQEDLTFECDEEVVIPTMTASDNCGTASVATSTDIQEEGSCYTETLYIYTATDLCGNTATQQFSVIVEDTTAPVISGDIEVTMPCDQIDFDGLISVADNCDMNPTVEVLSNEFVSSGSCAGRILRTYIAYDQCDNVSATFEQIITLTDDVNPTASVLQDFTVECDGDNVLEFDTPEFSDNCDDELTIESEDETTELACLYSVTRTWTATDNCDNSVTVSQTITVVDTMAPEFEFVPENAEFSCSETIVTEMATAFDACSDAVVTVEEETVDGTCPAEYSIVRTFTATDACGNTATATQTISVVDNEAPYINDEFISFYELECDQELPVLELPFTDDCSTVTVLTSDSVMTGECGIFAVERTFTATDACGNTATEFVYFSISDNTDPEFTNAPEDLVVDCTEAAPEAAELTATDNCDANPTVTYLGEEIIGEQPAQGSLTDCLGYDPIVDASEEEWALVLNAAGAGYEYYIADGDVSWVTYPGVGGNGKTATLTGRVKSTTGGNYGWDISVSFDNGVDWTSWMTQPFPTNFKDDAGLANGEHVNWTYYILNGDNATLTGWGDLAEDELSLVHAPSNQYYAFQEGIAANNRDAEYGIGGWFSYTGTILGEDANGAGDFAFDLDCCPRYEIVRTWIAEDCSGNMIEYTQIISFGDLGGAPNNGGNGVENVVDAGKGSFDVAMTASMYPNPAKKNATISFTVNTEDTRATLVIFDIAGNEIETSFDGNVSAGQNYRVALDLEGLSSGIYIYKLSNGKDVITNRFVISK